MAVLRFLATCTAAVGLLLTGVGCRHDGKLELIHPPEYPAYSESARKIIRKWTRTGRDISHFQTVLEVSAVFMSWNVRMAQIQDVVQGQAKSEPEKQELIQDQLLLHEKWFEFAVAVDSSDPDWIKLDDRNGIWQIYLLNEKGDRVEAGQVEEWEPESAELFKFYPFMSPWSRQFKIRFPARTAENATIFLNEPKKLLLDFRSIVGHVRLTWNLDS